MNWRTEIGELNIPVNLNHKTRLMSLGSCFSEAMGNNFLDYKFPVEVNPFGILFNPISIANLITSELDNRHYIESNDVYYHLDVHSKFRNVLRSSLEIELQDKKQQFDEAWRASEVVFITFGTAFVYDYLKTKSTVANCHKLPSKEFSKRLLSVDEIVSVYKEIVEANKRKKVVFTVSPVRHTKEGLSENMMSKSILRVACGELANQFTNCHYFPSYEIMLDDLRDYRFYRDDLIHVNQQGEQYIWEKVVQEFFDEVTKNQLLRIDKLKKKVEHKPFNLNTVSHLNFLNKTLKELQQLSEELDYSKEITFLENQIAAVKL